MTDIGPAPQPATTTLAPETPGHPPAIGLFELVLEVADLAAAERFYVDLLGLPVIERWGKDRPALWVGLGREGFLGLWAEEAGGRKGIHGSRGGAHVHLAIRVPQGTLDRMQARIESHGIAVERHAFGTGNHAIFLDDPDGNIVELTERVTLWGGGPATE